jgi:hypothetical protein
MEDDVDRSPNRIEDERVETILTEVENHELPPPLVKLLSGYQNLETARSPFMWKWVHNLAPSNTFPCVDHSYRDAVVTDKTILILFITLLDDILEKAGDRATFEELTKLPSVHGDPDLGAPSVDSTYVAFTEQVWERLVDRLQRGPQFERYADLFRFDIKQAITAIEYSRLAIQQPELATLHDIDRYESHNMVMFGYADIDLMHTSQDYTGELATIREAVWHAQKMARIGNWVSTWEREYRQGDYSSGIIIYALENDIVSKADLSTPSETSSNSLDSVVERIREAGVEEHFLTQWNHHHTQLLELNEQLDTIDLSSYIDGTETVLDYHLASTGLK